MPIASDAAERPITSPRAMSKTCLAPTSRPIGTASRKAKRAAASRVRPRPSAAVMVTPERDVPGTSASA